MKVWHARCTKCDTLSLMDCVKLEFVIDHTQSESRLSPRVSFKPPTFVPTTQTSTVTLCTNLPNTCPGHSRLWLHAPCTLYTQTHKPQSPVHACEQLWSEHAGSNRTLRHASRDTYCTTSNRHVFNHSSLKEDEQALMKSCSSQLRERGLDTLFIRTDNRHQ